MGSFALVKVRVGKVDTGRMLSKKERSVCNFLSDLQKIDMGCHNYDIIPHMKKKRTLGLAPASRKEGH